MRCFVWGERERPPVLPDLERRPFVARGQTQFVTSGHLPPHEYQALGCWGESRGESDCLKSPHWRNRASRSIPSCSLLPRVSGGRAGDEGGAPAKTCSRPGGADSGARINAPRFGPDCPRYADCPLTPAPLLQKLGARGGRTGTWWSRVSWAKKPDSLVSFWLLGGLSVSSDSSRLMF